MVWVIVLVPLALLWNLVMLAGLFAGRTNTPWRRWVLTACEIALFAGGFFILVAFVPLAAKAETKGEAKLAIYLASGGAVALGTALTYLEYLVAGRRRSFLPDLSRFFWFGR